MVLQTNELLLLVIFEVFLRKGSQEFFFLEKISRPAHSWEEDEELEDKDEGSAVLDKHNEEELDEELKFAKHKGLVGQEGSFRVLLCFLERLELAKQAEE